MSATATYRNALSMGAMLLEYRLESVLGAGGFGMTYLCTDTHLDKRVAIKEYFPADLAVELWPLCMGVHGHGAGAVFPGPKCGFAVQERQGSRRCVKGAERVQGEAVFKNASDTRKHMEAEYAQAKNVMTYLGLIK